MRILLVEPDYRRLVPSNRRDGKRPEDDKLWYPPLGLMKLARFHKRRGDEVKFVVGRNREVLGASDLFTTGKPWDRVYITTLFTYHFSDVVKTINFYIEAVGGTRSKVFVVGIMATLMRKEIYKETGIVTTPGTLTSARQIGLQDDTPIDYLPPDYEILDERYGISQTYYAYTTRGCTNNCGWCGVPQLEPEYIPYIDIKGVIRKLRDEYGDKPILKLMDNNILASPVLDKIVNDLLVLGYGRKQYTETQPRRQRVVDFNQGVDATHITKEKMELLSQLNIHPMRIAFDNVKEKKDYVRAVRLAHQFDVRLFSNYMLYNYRDTPRDLFERLKINIILNEELLEQDEGKRSGKIYSYPMRYAPIRDRNSTDTSKQRDIVIGDCHKPRNWLKDAIWTKRFIRNIEIMKGAANGAISPTPTLAWRTIGHDYNEFLANLYMPEELIRNRNRHEKKVYDLEPKRNSGTGKVEEFRSFIKRLLKKNDNRFRIFHNAVSGNSTADIRAVLDGLEDGELKKWLKMYLKQDDLSRRQISLLEDS